MATPTLTQDRVKELFSYDPETGLLTRRIKIKHFAAGVAVGSAGRRGYLHCSVDNRLYKVHRLIWLYVYGTWPTGQIDHINHNTADNRLCNLRDVSCAENHQNRARKTKSASGHLGVTWHIRDKRWLAHIEVKGKSYHLGSFTQLDAAIAARIRAEHTFHPERPKV